MARCKRKMRYAHACSGRFTLWPPAAGRFPGTLDPVCARCLAIAAGRDGETAPGSNKETDHACRAKPSCHDQAASPSTPSGLAAISIQRRRQITRYKKHDKFTRYEHRIGEFIGRSAWSGFGP